MRIVIASDLYWPTINGVATFSRNLAYGLADAGHDVIVIAPSQTGRSFRERDRNHWVYRTSSVPVPFFQNLRISVNPNVQVRHIIERFEPDVIHLQKPLGVGRAALAAAKRMDIPVVATNHAMPENLIDNLKLLAPLARPVSYLIKEYGSRFYSGTDYLTLPTQAAIDMLDNGDIKVPIVPVSNGIDLRRFRPDKPDVEITRRFHIPTNRPIVLYVGRLDAEKHLSVLVRAMARVLDDHSAHLLMVGHGNDADNLKLLIESLGIQRHVTFTGRVSDEDLPLLYHCGTVFVMPSPAELQSLTMLEAMASGLPVVAVEAGALYELCHHEQNGFLVPTDDDMGMAARILQLLDDEALRARMGRESVKIAKTHDLTHVIGQFEAIYAKVVRSHTRRLVRAAETQQ